MAGSGRLPGKFSAESFGWRALAGFAGLLAACVSSGLGAADEAGLVAYRTVGDAIPLSLTGIAGDPRRGRTIVVSRQLGLCLLCHSGPFPDERLQGSLAPDLAGVGSRLSAGQLRLRVVDASRVNPDTIMPPYYRRHDLTRVAPAYAGKPILNAQQVEDVVAFLATLTK
jgi:sulfur-oxidizing protein SoxX